MGMVVIMLGMVSELLAVALHINTYLLYIFGPPTLVGVLVTGAIGRTLRNRAAWYWLAFFSWMLLATLFSTWRGGSVTRDLDYVKFSLPLLFVFAGLALSWEEMRLCFYAVGVAGAINVISSRLFGASDQGRLGLDFGGSIGNPNDLASHLVLVLPFMLFIATDRKRGAIVRFSLLALIGYGVWMIFGTASRGGEIGAGVVFLFMLFRANARQRIGVLICGMTLALVVPMLLPSATRARLGSLFGGEHQEAQESEESRSYLFNQSVLYTVQHPLFGVGPDQFSNFEGKTRISEGEVGVWHATHCAFTQVSSECGIPALIFFLLGIGSAVSGVNKLWARARKQGFPDIARACFYYMTAFVGFLATITFLANAYRLYLPAMIGLGISLCAAGTRYMDQNAPVIPAAADPVKKRPRVAGPALPATGVRAF